MLFKWCFALVIFAAGAAGAGTISGRVFIDANGNGRFDAGEKGVAGCVVSDERTLARTDGEGRYQFEVPAGAATVFVVNAPGTWPVGRWWASIADGKKNQSLDFPIRVENQAGPFYFVHGTDTHLTAAALPLYRRYLDYVNALPVPVKFVVHTGDLIMDGLQRTPAETQKLFDLYNGANRALKPDLRNILGNHDLAGVTNPKVSEREPGYGKALFRQSVGPVNYAWRHGAYHFIALDGSTVEDRTVRSGLTQESADWAIAYLAGVATNEPVVLLIHQPLYPESDGLMLAYDPKMRPHEKRLLAALKDKRHYLTLAGHVHDRGEVRWGRATHVLGGAVSYAWHGLRPYPPTPRGCVLYRADSNRVDRAYLDWAEELSIDVRVPEFTGIVFGSSQAVVGSIADLRDEVKSVELSIGGKSWPAQLIPAGPLNKAFSGVVPITNLVTGVHELVIKAVSGKKSWTESMPVVVYSGSDAPFRATGPAKLRFMLDGEVPPGSRLLFNSRSPGALAPGHYENRTFTFDIPANRLRRLNELNLNFSTPDEGPLTYIKGVTLEYGGREFRDVRFSPLARRPLLPMRFHGPTTISSFVDLEYDDRAMREK
ncbi:MAG: metallophosphoesterase [Verrucomicrobia bacterium]|nr:metallophosphoesterase [Verrucomicrobiota bacterium]